jgi:hypothetical protein
MRLSDSWKKQRVKKKVKTMKIINQVILGAVTLLFACCLISKSSAQSQPRLTLSKTSPTLVQINWTNQVGTTYRVWSTTNLAMPFSSWPPLEDAFSADSTVSVYASTTDTPLGFFLVQIPTNSSTANVQIFSPANTQTVSGEIGVRMGAQLGTQVQGANLYLDGALVGYLNSGGMGFNLDTTHFANGQHTAYVGAVDTANNETASSSITLDFENTVRWLDATSLFNYYVPIDVDSDIYPADWLVTVTDTNGTIVRTISDSTTDGTIQTTWDGTDDYGQSLPVENLYQITVDVVASGGSSMMRASSLASALGVNSVSFTTNPHGVPEYTVQKPAPNPLTAYLNALTIYSQLAPKEKLIYPPLPPRPAGNPYATTTVKMSARQMFLAVHQSSSASLSLAAGTATPNAGSSSGAGSTSDWVWWEMPWQSQHIIVARVPIPGTYNTTVANNCNQIAELISTAALTVGDNRDVFTGFVQVIQTANDVYGLTNQFVNPNVTAFYGYMHGGTNGNTIGTVTVGISAKTVGAQLGNTNMPSLGAGPYAGKYGIFTHKPFNFVFLDGCNTGLGDFPEAFGIPKVISGSQIDDSHRHRRAFMGWTGPVVFQVDPSHIDWSLQFWSAWLGGSYHTSLTEAIRLAYQHDPSVFSNVPIKWYGNGSLTWSD